jgi:Na+-driven multidrug efflux pump
MQTLFEAGKETASAVRNLLLISIFIYILMLSDTKVDINVPFLNLKLQHQYALAVLILLHAASLYRFAILGKYERKLAELFMEDSDVTVTELFKSSFPSSMNFTKFHNIILPNGNSTTVSSISSLLGIVCVFAIPLLYIAFYLYGQASWLVWGACLFSFIFYFASARIMSIRLVKKKKSKQAKEKEAG